MVNNSDTIFALSTPYGRSGVATFRVSGALPCHELRSLLSLPSLAPRYASLCQLVDQQGNKVDDVVATYFPAPNSFTGEDVLEISCHGSVAILAQIEALLGGRTGWRQAQPGEFARRAFRNQKIDLAEAEGLADVLEAKTIRQLKHAQRGAWGANSAAVQAWRQQILELQALAEAVIDFSEDLDEDIDDTITNTAKQFAGDLDQALRRGNSVAQLQAGYTVALVGAPNAGKSSLLNALTQTQAAIVTDLPGTTRDQITVEVNIDGLPVKLVDTAGLRETDDHIEQIGVARSRQAIVEADLVLHVVRPGTAPEPIDGALRVYTHADVKKDGVYSVSSITGEGIDSLLALISKSLAADLPAPDEVAFSNARQQSAVARAVHELQSVTFGAPLDIRAQHLRYASQALSEITGDIDVEDVLDQIFGNFCIGK